MSLVNFGKVIEVKDGIIFADGLSDVGYNEMVEIQTENEKITGLALNLEEEKVGIVVLGNYLKIKEGDEVFTTGKPLSISVSDEILGTVIDPLGRLLNESSKNFQGGKAMPLERIAPGVIDRQNVYRPLQTGIIAIDAMFPIGRGQRELIIGDRQTGKSAICIDTIINQKKENIKCIYVAIGQKASKIAQMKAKLEEAGAMDYTVIVAANASDPVSLQYIAPYAGCAIGEFFAEKGEDALIIYDDLTKHSWAYREISLLLSRPPGREAYPGDIFYIHSKLLERAVQYSKEKGGGSLTALPVVETQAGDISAYIPTNIISITDGQIYLEADLFNAGQKPAINVGLSVSRVGGDAQIKPMKQVSGQLKLDLAQYRELSTFAQFGSDLDVETQKRLDRGAKLMEILKQDQYKPMPVEEQILVLFASNIGFIDEIPISKLKEWKVKFVDFVRKNGKEVFEFIKKNEKIEGKNEEMMKNLIKKFQL